MHEHDPDGLGPELAATLEPGEVIQVLVRAAESVFVVTANRVAIGVGTRVTFNVPIEGLRRLQFDIEADRPAVLALVPESAAHEPQMIAIPPHAYDDVARALAFVGHRLGELRGVGATG
jgi:hypothetical protein